MIPDLPAYLAESSTLKTVHPPLLFAALERAAK
jgi:hypothetical protein